MESSQSVSEDNCQATESRIPTHVFAPTSGASQAEWSTASNESLFSIHMSFNEKPSLISKSEEMDPTTISSPLFEFSVSSATPRTPKDESHQNNHPNLGRTMSQLSDTSVKSFAFPILTAERDKNNTGKKGTKSRTTPPETPEAQQSSTPKANQDVDQGRCSCFSCFPSS
ncbi:uncharacterized protein LOC120158654 [Hibiscus syriacus]|uniref:uncharacterized protein LOC120158654 n=1 Tax=Hibiscus syriacus TaxID=106335 RepID=UPI001922200D|nr:uncharacterized protein LOC120158654 [Hibiscus syriacus]